MLNAIIQAVVQGLTEFLPVSSSGHLSLVSHFTGHTGDSATLLLVILHLGTLVAVFIAFWNIIWALIKEFFIMIKDIFTGKFKWKDMNPERRMIMMLMISCIPLVFFYIPEMKWNFFSNIENDGDILIEGFCFLYTAIILFMATRCKSGKKTAGDIKTKDAVTIGIFQCIALLPGISRSGSTISAGLFRGLDRETAVQYSFILGIPPILAGSLVEIKDAVGEGISGTHILPLIVGFIVAAIVGFLSIKLIQLLLKSDKFIIFSAYTFILGIAVIAIAVIEKINGVACITELFK